ncbi:MAG TPA: hypothetical protein VM582_04055 [Candidatus Thermoplasmatota archaeon]|nr:hypothetical protein [Candidatus Thermoplasmatota archaeon]
MKAALLLGALLLLTAGCVNVYESGSEPEVDCEVTRDPAQLDDGATNPLRCEREDAARDGATQAEHG